MKDIIDKRADVRSYIEHLDEMAFWFAQKHDYMTDEIGVMFESALSRLLALDSAITIRIRQLSEQKLADAMQNKIASKERINNVRDKIENQGTVERPSRPAKGPIQRAKQTKPSARPAKVGNGRAKPVQAKRRSVGARGV